MIDEIFTGPIAYSRSQRRNDRFAEDTTLDRLPRLLLIWPNIVSLLLHGRIYILENYRETLVEPFGG